MEALYCIRMCSIAEYNFKLSSNRVSVIGSCMFVMTVNTKEGLFTVWRVWVQMGTQILHFLWSLKHQHHRSLPSYAKFWFCKPWRCVKRVYFRTSLYSPKLERWKSWWDKDGNESEALKYSVFNRLYCTSTTRQLFHWGGYLYKKLSVDKNSIIWYECWKWHVIFVTFIKCISL